MPKSSKDRIRTARFGVVIKTALSLGLALILSIMTLKMYPDGADKLSGIAGALGSILFAVPVLSQLQTFAARRAHLGEITAAKENTELYPTPALWQEDYVAIEGDYQAQIIEPPSWFALSVYAGTGLLIFGFLTIGLKPLF